MSENPYQPFFDRLDKTVVKLTDKDQILDGVDFDEAADLLRRAGFVLANLLNVNAQVLPTLILEPETVAGETGDPDSGGPESA